MSQDPVPAGEAGALASAAAKFETFFGGEPGPDVGTVVPEAGTPPAAPEQAAGAPPEPVQAEKAPEPEPEQPGSLAELIRQQRQDRAARQAKEREAQDYKAKLAEVEEKLNKYSKADLVNDPIGFAQAHGLSEQDMALIGEAYLYHLVPEKAPADLRYRMLEAKQKREQSKQEQERQRQAVEAAEAEAAQRIQHYAGIVQATVQTWSQGEHPFPESSAWFGGNHEEYTQSLMHTANNLAESARARGEVADLSPKAVASVLERDLSARAARIRQGGKPTQQSVPPAPKPDAGKQPAVMSTRGQGASPQPPAVSEEERIRRATEAIFGSR